MSKFLKSLSEKLPDHIILLVLDNAETNEVRYRHMTQNENSKRRRKNNKNAKPKFKTPERLIIPDNIHVTYIGTRLL